MRAFIVSFAGLALLGGIIAWIVLAPRAEESVVDARGQEKVSIVLTDEGFAPRYVRISAGTEIVFTTTRSYQFWPASNEHPAHTIFPDFDPRRPLEPNEAWSFTFERSGEWRFHDHVRSYYTGTIYVEE